jgi:hypothetical protein
MNAQKILPVLYRSLFWIPTIFFSLLLSHNAFLGGEYGILPEKIAARQDVAWNIAFYIHLPFGVLCLLTPVVLLAFRHWRYPVRFHKALGLAYCWTTWVIVCPSGMYLALYAKGGLITQMGFLLQGILLGYFTYRGFKSIQAHDKTNHFRFMVRSYAVALVVVSFRIYHIIFFMLEIPYQDNYAISQWLGLSGNALIAELVLLKISINTSTTLNSKYYEIT